MSAGKLVDLGRIIALVGGSAQDKGLHQSAAKAVIDHLALTLVGIVPSCT